MHWERGFWENECVIHPMHVLGTCHGSPEGPPELGYDGALTSAARRPRRQTGVEMSLHGAAGGTPHKRGQGRGLPAEKANGLGFQEGLGVGWVWGRERAIPGKGFEVFGLLLVGGSRDPITRRWSFDSWNDAGSMLQCPKKRVAVPVFEAENSLCLSCHQPFLEHRGWKTKNSPSCSVCGDWAG